MDIVGRSSSHFTRVVRIFALELGVPFHFVVVSDLMARDASAFAGNPALKIPALRRGDSLLFGTENICRALADDAPASRRIVWPEQLRDDRARNAQELVWHAMAAQVQLVLGTLVNGLPADNAYFAKGRAGFEGALAWLNEHVDAVLDALPARDLSLLEVTLFCLVEHLVFRQTLPLAPHSKLAAFAERFRVRSSAVATAYAFDAPTA